MKNIGLIALMCSFFISTTLSAMESLTGGYTTKNRKIWQLVENEPEWAFAYGILRLAIDSGDGDFVSPANQVWREIKEEGTLNKDQLEEMVMNYWDDLSPALQKRAIDLGFVDVEKDEETPHFWDKCELRFGSNVTTALKIGAGVAIVSCLVVMPVAAAVMPQLGGTFRDSCQDIRVKDFRSTDPNIAEHDLSIVSAQCSHDRSCHGLMHNEIVVPNDGSACMNIHNSNGTLVVTDSMQWSGSAGSALGNSCPPLEGSFQKSCDPFSAKPYKSLDSRVPEGSFCQYDVTCNKEGSGKSSNTIILPKGSVGCVGKRIENCDGALKVRKGVGDDHQCDKNWRAKKGEL